MHHMAVNIFHMVLMQLHQQHDSAAERNVNVDMLQYHIIQMKCRPPMYNRIKESARKYTAENWIVIIR